MQITLQKLHKEQNEIRKILDLVGWSKDQIQGQLSVIEKFLQDTNCLVVIAKEGNQTIGYISAEFYNWNKLGQIHGLVIHPEYRRKGFAANLVREVEVFMKGHKARGVYVDTPTNNVVGCAFYRESGFAQGYIMPEYYDVGVDGVTFIKFFAP